MRQTAAYRQEASRLKRQDTANASAPRSVAELKARGYVQKGTISKAVTASKLAGGKWKSADTYYTIRDKVIPGNAINESRIERAWSSG